MGSRLHKGNVLALIMFVVHNENHLVKFVIRMLAYDNCFLQVIRDRKEKVKSKKSHKKGFY